MRKYVILKGHLYWQAVFYLVPLVLLFAISFWRIDNYQLTPDFSLSAYLNIISTPLYMRALANSLWLAFGVGVLAVAISVPISSALAFRYRGRVRIVVLFLLFVPFFSNYTIRMFSWQPWLNDSGLISTTLAKIGINKSGLIYTMWAVRIGLLSFLIPIAALITYLSFSRIDRRLHLAARNLGASPMQIFAHINLPLSLPGILVSFLFTFIIAFGDFTSPSILGGNQTYMISVLVQDRVKVNDWPTAAALGMIMLMISLTLIVIIIGLMQMLPAMKKVVKNEDKSRVR